MGTVLDNSGIGPEYAVAAVDVSGGVSLCRKPGIPGFAADNLCF